MIIGIAGGSGSGKSYFCQQLIKRLGKEHCCLISQDSYYHGASSTSSIEERAAINYDHPDSIDFDLLLEHLLNLRNGFATELPVYDFNTHTRTTLLEKVSPLQFLIVEGILILSQPKLSELLDISIYVDTSYEVRLERRIERDLVERGRTKESVLKQMSESVLPMHDQYVEPSKRNADLIISGQGSIEESLAKVTTAIQEFQRSR